MERWWNNTDGGETEVLGEQPFAILLCPPQTAHGLAWNWADRRQIA
jgi:hypothetical protein